MTEPNTKGGTPIKRTILIGITIVGLCLAIWVYHFLSSFNLNDYRQGIENKLSGMISLPVKIGKIEYTYHDAFVALQLDDISIGDSDSLIRLSSSNVTIDLKWRGLIQQKIQFARIELTQPEISISYPDNRTESADESAPLLIDQALLYDTQVKEISIRNGRIHFEFPEGQKSVEFYGVDAHVKNLRLNHNAEFSMSSSISLPESKAPSTLQVEGSAGFWTGTNRGITPEFDITLKAKELDANAVAQFSNASNKLGIVQGNVDLEIHGEKILNDHCEFQANITSESLNILPATHYTKPINIEEIALTGQWHPEQQNFINDLKLFVDQSQFSGQLAWQSQPDTLEIHAEIHKGKMNLAQLQSWLPEKTRRWQELGYTLQDNGALTLENILFSYLKQGDISTWQIEKGKVMMTEAFFTNPKQPAVLFKSLHLELLKDMWQLNASMQSGSTIARATGKGLYDIPQLHVETFDIEGKMLPGLMLADLEVPQRPLTTSGEIGFTGHFEGPIERLVADISFNLSKLSITHPAGIHLSPEPGDNLTLHATLTPENIVLDHGSIRWAELKGHLNGSYSRGAPDSLVIDSLLRISDLKKVAKQVPLLEQLDLKGQADLSLSIEGQTELHSPKMIFTLRDASLRATRHIADINNINGRISISPEGFKAQNLHLQLGESPITVNATLDDFNNPQLSLDVSSPAVRAKDVIFYSDTAQLHDLKGHLKINKEGLKFDSVNVSLKGGTDATVRGFINFSPPYAVDLDITSNNAVISEVIDLWTNQSNINDSRQDSQESSQTETSYVPITIKASVNTGDLYGMKFQNATGVISPTHRSLTIHPLDFSVGKGYCNAQVITDFSSGDSSLLRISGHAEDVDALEVYRELLNQKNIVRGNLRGDFYLEGEVGSQFLPTSVGRFNIEVRNGVLHKFPILSKVFSLLNISQFFALELPDMDRNGMPFNKLRGNLQLDQGIISSQDLTINSKAMNQSYRGQLDLTENIIDMEMAIHPLGTIDKIISQVPVAGWLLTGEDQALLTAHFAVKGRTENVSVQPMPLVTLSEPTIGLLKRVLELPFKLIEDPQILWGGRVKRHQKPVQSPPADDSKEQNKQPAQE